MRFRSTAARALAPALMSVLGLGALASGVAIASVPAASAATAHHHGNDGWIRLAHLSPNTPPVDVYLYSFGNSHAMIVLHHVAYGTVSPYEKVKVGEYTVAMRLAGAKASSQPVLSTSVQITAGGAFTVAGMGPAKGLRLQGPGAGPVPGPVGRPGCRRGAARHRGRLPDAPGEEPCPPRTLIRQQAPGLEDPPGTGILQSGIPVRLGSSGTKTPRRRP